MATRVVYNGVTLYNVLTREWRQEVVYDESGTDKIAEKFRLSFVGTIHPYSPPISTTYVSGPSNGAISVSNYQDVSRRLSEPRQILQVYFGSHQATSQGGLLVLEVDPVTSPAGGPAMDVDNGPKPISLELVRVFGAHAFRVQWTIEAVRNFCPTGYQESASLSAQHSVLSNRWRVGESLDANFFTTRTIEGTMRLARSVATPAVGLPAHYFKTLVVPLLEDGFRRDRIDFAVEPDNVTCRYTVVDRQVHTAPPAPATKMDVTHSESTADGANFFSTLSVRLEGPPHADKREMLARMIDIAVKKIEVSSVTNNLIENLEIIDHIGEANAVEANFRVRHIQTDSREAITKLQTDTWGKPLELDPIPIEGEDDHERLIYNPHKNPVPYPYGYNHDDFRSTATLFLVHCYLQSPCNPLHNIAQAEQEAETTEWTGERGEASIFERSPGELQESQSPSYAAETQAGMYTYTTMTTRYVYDHMRVQMPIAGNPSGASSVVFDLADPQVCRLIECDLERVAQPPRIPFPRATYTQGNVVATLKRHEVEPFAVSLSPDGSQRVYRITARYWYMLDRPPGTSATVRIGRKSEINGNFVPATLSFADVFDEGVGP